MKKILLSFYIAVFLLFCSGCWDYIEYEQMAQVYSMGIDYNKNTNKVTITLQYIAAQKSQGEKPGDTNQDIVFSATANSAIDALAKLQDTTPNRLFYGYLQVVVIGQNAAKYIFKDVISLLDQTPNVRNSVYVVVASKKAKGILSTTDKNSTEPSGKKIHDLLDSGSRDGSTFIVTLHDLTVTLTKVGVESVLSKIITTGSPNGKPSGGTANNVNFSVKNKGNLSVNGLAAFKYSKLIGWLNGYESIGLSLIKGGGISFYRSVKAPRSLPKSLGNKKNIFFFITNSKSKIKVKLHNENPQIYVTIKVQASLRKYYTEGGNDYFTPTAINSMKKGLEAAINKNIKSALKKGQKELKSDIFGFGFALYRQYPQMWHQKYESNWNKMFPAVPVVINVDASINNTGTVVKKFFVK